MIEPHKNDTQEQPKKPYTPPQLTVYGNVEQITQGGRIGIADGVLSGSIISDRNLKEHLAAVDGRDILARMAAVPSRRGTTRIRIRPSATSDRWRRILPSPLV